MAQVNEMRMSVQNILIMLMNNMGMDAPQNIEEITDFVFEDVMETADPVNWHSGDVAIAFRRWVEHQSETDIDKDEDGNCLYCGTKCFRGEMCDEQQAGGFRTPKSAEDVSLGKTLYNIGELRYLLEGLDDRDQICIEACDLDTGDVQDLYPLALDVIDGIRLTDGTEVREVRFCQRPNSAPDNRDKQPIVDALIDVLAEDIQRGDVTVLDELLLKMPFDVLKYALPEDMWADFEEPQKDGDTLIPVK